MTSKKILYVWPNFCADDQTVTRTTEAARLFKREVRDKRIQGTNYVLVPVTCDEGRKPRKTLLQSYWSAFLKHVLDLKPDVIVPLGSFAFTAVTGKRLSHWGGREIECELGSRTYKVVGAFHPDHAVRYPVRGRELLTHLDNVAKLGSGRKWDQCEWHVIDDVDEGTRIVESMIERGRMVVIDYETTDLDPTDPEQRIRCVGLCQEPGVAYAFDFEAEPGLQGVYRGLLESRIPLGAHGAKFEHRWTQARFGIVPRITDDSMILHHMLHQDASHRLELLAYNYTDIGGYDTRLKELLDSGQTYASVPMDDLAHYCCGDVDATQRIIRALRQELFKHPERKSLERVYRGLALPTACTLAKVENVGMHLNPKLDRIIRGLESKLEKEKDLLNRSRPVVSTLVALGRAAQEGLNTNSVVQMRYLLFEELKLPVLERTKKGEPSTKDEVLESYEKGSPLVARIRRVRSLDHDIMVLKDLLSRKRTDGCVTSNYKQEGTVTFRLASTDPNLQNMPRQGDVKKAFTSRFGKNGVVLQGDYKQLEVRLMGGISEEPGYVAAFENGEDIHAAAASVMYDLPIHEVSKEQRTNGKRNVFGTIYGIGPSKLSKQMGVSKQEASKLIHLFEKKNPRITRWKRQQVSDAKARGFTQSAFGRIRNLPDIRHRDDLVRWRAERQASNFPIQSTGSDITVLAMNRLQAALEKEGMRSVIIGQVHDSILMDVLLAELDRVKELFQEVCVDGINKDLVWLKIDLEMDVTYGATLKDAE